MDKVRNTSHRQRLFGTGIVLGLSVISCALLSPPAHAETTSVGVHVDAMPTTVPPAGPSVKTGNENIIGVPGDESIVAPESRNTATTESTSESTTDQSLLEELPPVNSVDTANKSSSGGVLGQISSAVRVTKEVLKNIFKGMPIADALEAALPAPIAAVVVPAVRTASTFAFPLGLAAAVIAFLVLQQRIDSSDPKMSAAPLAHDDDEMVFEEVSF